MAGPRLLYIGGDSAFGRFVQRRLQARGYEVGLARAAGEGMGPIGEGAVDVVVLDHDTPGQDGLAALDAILALPDPPAVVYVTSTPESSIAVAALKAGALDYVAKGSGDDAVGPLEAALGPAMARVAQRREKAAADRQARIARDRFEALAAEREVLMREVNHRVGNSLQLVGTFLHMQALSSQNPETREALAEANRRVLAIAQVHRRLHASDDVKQMALKSYLAGLIEDIRQSADAGASMDPLSLAVDDLMIDAETAVTIGVIVTELVINAMKHAYPEGQGPIRVSLKALDGLAAYRLSVEDTGVGNAAPEALMSGVGTTIIKAMASKLETTVTYESANPGTRASMVIATSVLTARHASEAGLS